MKSYLISRPISSIEAFFDLAIAIVSTFVELNGRLWAFAISSTNFASSSASIPRRE